MTPADKTALEIGVIALTLILLLIDFIRGRFRWMRRLRGGRWERWRNDFSTTSQWVKVNYWTQVVDLDNYESELRKVLKKVLPGDQSRAFKKTLGQQMWALRNTAHPKGCSIRFQTEDWTGAGEDPSRPTR